MTEILPGKDGRRESGAAAEEAAARFLEQRGYRILARNFNVPRIGELDIVALREGTVHIVEVRARQRGSRFGTGADSITPSKIRRIRNAASIYLDRMQYLNNDVKLLAADVQLDSQGKVGEIHWIPLL